MNWGEYQYYRYCLSHNKPYFGAFAIPGPVKTYTYMLIVGELICRERKNKLIKICEIGSWAGASAITWAEAIKKFNKGRGLVCCIDPWKPWRYKAHSDYSYSWCEIYDLFLHNIKAKGYDDIILPFKGSSDDILPLFKDETFDLIYIDGAHDYNSVYKDIANSARLVSEGGILCGDDLDLQLFQVDQEYARKHRHIEEPITDPKTKVEYHPGVTVAIGDFFGKVSVYGCFWVMRKRNDKWEEVNLQVVHPEEDYVPPHLRDSLEEDKPLGNSMEDLRYVLDRTVKTGERFVEKGRLDKARAIFSKMLERINITKGVLINNLAVIDVLNGNLEAAESLLGYLIKKGYQVEEANRNLAMVRELLAQEQYRREVKEIGKSRTT